MFALSHRSGLAFIALTLAYAIVEALDYKLVPDSTDILSPCTDPNSASMDNVDISGMEADMVDDDIIELKGVVQYKWNLGSSDNFELTINTYQEKGSEYVPTVFNAQRRDGCQALFEVEEPWFDTFIKVLPEDDRVCPAQNKELIWHMEPSNFSMILKNLEGSNKEGNYKIVVNMKPYDQTGKYYEDLSICFEVLGYLSRL